MNFGATPQSLVDAAFLALGILRAPKQMWEPLDKTTKRNLVKALQATRQVLPGQNNWLLFAAMVEAGLCFMGEWWDPMRVDYAIQQHKEWFVGDGTYGDGPHFHWDYYNSLVIQPMLLQVVETVQTKSPTWSSLRPVVLESAALCGDSGADDQPGGYVSCDWAITDVPVWSISPVERHQPAEAVACGGNAPAGAVRPDGGDAADDREAGDLRCQGLADDWGRRIFRREVAICVRRRGCRWGCRRATTSGRVRRGPGRR
jgi:hypothetical protein